MTKVTKGELQKEAKNRGINPEQSYEKLREEIDIYECKWCNDEFINGWKEDEFCTETCEVQYINKNFR